MSVPVWAIGAKWYVVDVPNFANGEKSNDPPGTKPRPLRPPSQAPANNPNAAPAGGDLLGLTKRLPYLADLGVDTLYLVGINLALKGSGDRDLAEFLNKAHHKGFRVVVAAPSNPKELAAITRRWMDPNGDGRSDDGVDGWVAGWPGGRPIDAWKQWYALIKHLNPEALVVADMRDDTTLMDPSGLFDTFIDYSTGKAIVEFFRDGKLAINPAALFEKLASARTGRSLESRLASPMGLNRSGPRADLSDRQARAAWRLALVFQHFYAGAPLTYYGDEIGLAGRGRSRGAMLWPDLPGAAPVVRKNRDDLASLLQWLHARRDADAPLRRGGFRLVLADGDRRVLAFARSTENGEAILLMNYGDAKQKVMLPAGEPGMRVNVLTPLLDPEQRLPQFGRKAEPPVDHIKPRRMAASHQVINRSGIARLWVDPMSVRIVLVACYPKPDPGVMRVPAAR